MKIRYLLPLLLMVIQPARSFSLFNGFGFKLKVENDYLPSTSTIAYAGLGLTGVSTAVAAYYYYWQYNLLSSKVDRIEQRLINLEKDNTAQHTKTQNQIEQFQTHVKEQFIGLQTLLDTKNEEVINTLTEDSRKNTESILQKITQLQDQINQRGQTARAEKPQFSRFSETIGNAPVSAKHMLTRVFSYSH